MPVTRSDDRKSDDRGKLAKGPACPSCGTATLSEARFCHDCGASLEGGTGGKWSAGRLAVWGAVAGLIVLPVFAVMIFSGRDSAPPTSAAPPTPMFNTLPDLSQMTTREAADRLFNRIMTASEQGNRAEALRFVPMAVQAYEALRVLDRDARYHLALIHGVAGDRANTDRQIAALRKGAPDHLLALVLEHESAVRSGDRAAESRVLAAFAAAYDSEIATEKPEYLAHRNTIERLRDAYATRAEPIGAAQ